MDTGTLEPETEIGKSQFQQELNKWFESRGIIADLRSHLRHLMITALQSTQIGLKPTESNSPKDQALNLMVAEYLFRRKCHYTLSVFTSEVPTLANFNPNGAKLPEGRKKHHRKNCFQANEVEEILNAMGMSSREEEIGVLKTTYLEKGNEASLFELFLQRLGEMSTKLQIRRDLESHVEEPERLLSKKWSSRVADVLLSEKVTPTQITAMEEAIFRITEPEIRRVVKEERKSQLQALSQREKRIQECLKKHEDEILFRLMEAERNLTRRKDVIDGELTEREKRLTEMALEWKHKHEEILKLSKSFHDIESENRLLQKKLKLLEEENSKLQTEGKTQSKTITDLQGEMNLLLNKLKEVTDSNAMLSERIQELINRENKEVLVHHDSANQKTERPSSDEIPLLWSRNTAFDDINPINRHSRDESEPKVKSKEFTIKSQTTPRSDHWNITEPAKTQLGAGDAKPNKLTFDFVASDVEDVSLSSSSEEIITGVRKKLQDLEEETIRINQNYFEFKQKNFSVDSDSESSKTLSGKSPRETQNEIVIKETKFSQTDTENIFVKVQKLKDETKQRKNDFVSKRLEEMPKPVVWTPTKRQLQNRDFFLKSRQLLQELEKENLQTSTSAVESCSSTSGEDLTGCSKQFKKKSPLRSKEVQKKPSVESVKKVVSPSYLLRSDIDCLALLEEARIKSPQVSARKPLRQGILLSESEKEEEKEDKIVNRESNGESSFSGKVSVGKSSGFL